MTRCAVLGSSLPIALAGLVGVGCIDSSEPIVLDTGRGVGGAEIEEDPPRVLGPNPGTLPGGVPWTTRLARLTHGQYDNTVSDLLGLDVAISSEFLEDPSFSGFDNDREEMRVVARLGGDYRRAAEALAARFVEERDLREEVSCALSEVSCGAEFIQSFGRRAYRRPLTDSEQKRFAQLFERGAQLAENNDPFLDGVQVVVQAMLQSPHFLYRVELTNDVEDDGFIDLSDYELATRLSYLFWNTMPDEELLEAAENGELTREGGLAEQARRLTESPRLSAAVLDFHHQWLGLDHYRNLTKDSASFPDYGPDLEEAFIQEAHRFIEDVLVTERRGMPSLFTAPYTFVNSDLASIYGLDGSFGADFERVDLPSGERGGLFTQPGFLAAHAYPDDSSPIHRGVFLLRQVLCEDIPPPPGDIDLTLPETTNDIVTTRDQVELHTSSASCNGCHSLINPIGFAFENFDAIGQFRSTDNGGNVVASGQVELPSGELVFEDAADLTAKMAKSPGAASCYAHNWARYAYGRSETLSDDATIRRFAERLIDDDYSVSDLLIDITDTKAFSHRPPNED